MNLLTITETKDSLLIQVNYTDTDGCRYRIVKEPFGIDAQLRKLVIAFRELSNRIEKHDNVKQAS